LQPARTRILVVDDEVKMADRLAERLRLRGFKAFTAYDGKSALDFLKTNALEGMILDLRLPDIHGIAVLRQTKRTFPDIRVVILSGHGTEEDFRACRELGACACLHKPAKIDTLIKAISNSEVE
jgi:DNA-binding response OmpR family regulator